MPKPPGKPRKPKDPAKPTRAKAAREPLAPIAPALERLLNPGIEKGTAGPGSQTGLTAAHGSESERAQRARAGGTTFGDPSASPDDASRRRPLPAEERSGRKPAAGGLKPPADNSFDRRTDFAEAHKARLSTPQGFREAPQKGYVGREPLRDSRTSGFGPLVRPLKSSPGPLDPDLARQWGIDGEEGDAGGLSLQAEGADEATRPRKRTQDIGGPIAGIASQRALDALLREGRPEFSEKPWVPHRPPRPEKSEGGQRFVIKSDFAPKGDQPQAIADLVVGVRRNDRSQVLLGVTGSGKTYTMAKVIEAIQRPALILAPNKTLAAQLYGEFRSFFPDNAVEYFVSYYDYYQPEAYVPRTDTYIEKESSINEQIDRMRHSATRSLLERDDVIIVASVSCIYGIGSVETYSAMTFTLKQGERL